MRVPRLNPSTALVVLLLVCAVGDQTSARREANYRIFGRGEVPCSEWTEAQHNVSDTLPYLHNATWVLGFASGVDYARARGIVDLSQPEPAGKKLDSERVMWWVNDYCREHPNDTIATAAETLVREVLPSPDDPPLPD